MDRLGNFYQGQVITIVLETDGSNTAEERQQLVSNDVYLGIYNGTAGLKVLLSTADGTLMREVSASKVKLSAVLTPKMTKNMNGCYQVEVLIKNANNTFANPCENVIEFTVNKRRISEVIK